MALGELQDVLEELEVRLVSVVGLVRLGQIRNERASACGDVLRHGERSSNADNILAVEIGFATVGRGSLVIGGSFEGNNSVVLALGVRSDVGSEQLEIGVARRLLEVAAESNLAATLGVRLVVDLVQALQALRGDVFVLTTLAEAK